MKIVIAKTSGFCMGVRRAVEMALDAPAQHEKPIFTYGPLIHNPQVLALFAEKGVTILEKIPDKGQGTVLVRAHGVPPATKLSLKKAGFTVVDATCPRVVKVQSIIRSHARKGYAVIIVGDEAHPEVIGLQGYAGAKGSVVGSLAQFQALPDYRQAIVVAQTTQNQKLYRQIKHWAGKHHPNYKVFDTICDSTEKRQTEVCDLAQMVDAVIVVGGKSSGNTRRLAEIVVAEGKPAYHVETEAELDLEALAQAQTIGITAGASTPSWIIKRIIRSIEQIPLRRWQGWRSFTLSVQRFLLLTNFYVALGAGCLCYAAMKLQGMPVIKPAMAVAMLYVISMHILNHLTGRAEDKYNDPEREKYYRTYKIPLTLTAILAGALGLVAALQMGRVAFWTLLAMSLLGLSYNLRLLPRWVSTGRSNRRIRDLPGSKTILIALAWGVVTALLPALVADQSNFTAGLLTTLWAVGIVFGRTAFFDILDMQGDRIVGKETIPLLLGQKRSFLLLKAILGVTVLLLVLAGSLGALKPLSYLLAVCPLLLGAIILSHEKGDVLPGIRMEFWVESIFVLSGVMAFGYSFL
jgi:(E)-4-hydroxy-3-methyl-but-2-enyl pyrophosphate reductase